MSRKVVPGLSELVYSLICDNPGAFKHDLHRMVHERLHTRITESDLSDVISFLKLHRGVFVIRGYGYFKDEETFNYNRFGKVPGKEIRKQRR
ncbi:hypothetical protein NAK51_002896 [Salmonella enterica]|nr:hypothetical protein [Salmonella enterica]EHW9861118.1 hypothetical protein [Salmonella enterica subsp. enterica serovar Poona]EBI1924849.1 hypothetical protein [Salmonella enterica]EHM1731248.1 hypothetical protein [Salmonella enterica]EHO1656888.1 hypothetical protein [Salmonella enterica]